VRCLSSLLSHMQKDTCVCVCVRKRRKTMMCLSFSGPVYLIHTDRQSVFPKFASKSNFGKKLYLSVCSDEKSSAYLCVLFEANFWKKHTK
jgi:hypothetical protein